MTKNLRWKPKNLDRVGKNKLCLAMKKLDLEQMETINGGLTGRQAGCFYLGLAAGIASAMNPIVGGLTTLGCLLITPS